jgi:hypothetical protein
MKLVRQCAAGIAAAMLIGQPCAAATDFRAAEATDVRMAAFAGLHVRLPLVAAAKPIARLQLTTGYTFGDASSGARRTMLGQGFEIGVGQKGVPTYFLAGQSAAELHRKLGIHGGTGTTLLIVGGVLVAAVVVALAAGGGAGFGDTCPTVGGDRSHCIHP